MSARELKIHTFELAVIVPIYTRDGSSVWDELGQRTVVRLERRTSVVVRLDG